MEKDMNIYMFLAIGVYFILYYFDEAMKLLASTSN